ncbi:MAG: MoaD/ThiS family protein [Planctomycetota bacterium]|jgi:molybdopterin converting factor subunit 1|nr:MoaD/ThiS family protein [Planctomycetota bacterium]MDP6940589.1 MoaD/ThiS family protein [Planctomycetota bacterium]
MIRVLLFAGLKERAGKGSLELNVEPAATVAELRTAAIAACPSLDSQVFRIALGNEYAEEDDILGEVQEVAFIPPVSGG